MTEKQIDAAAKALRETLQAGKKLNAWETLPNSTKRKWLGYAAIALAAAEREGA